MPNRHSLFNSVYINQTYKYYMGCFSFSFSLSHDHSVRYHNLNPNYIHERLKQLGQTFTLRVLLVQVDVVSLSVSLTFLCPFSYVLFKSLKSMAGNKYLLSACFFQFETADVHVPFLCSSFIRKTLIML